MSECGSIGVWEYGGETLSLLYSDTPIPQYPHTYKEKGEDYDCNRGYDPIN